MLQAELKILGGKHQGKLIPLSSRKFLVGREQDCHLRPNSDLVSRHHCVFSIDDYAIRLRDLGSTNGTLVNGTALRGEVILKSGDRVSIGKLDLEVVIRQASAVQPTAKRSAPSPSIQPPVATVAEIPTPVEEVDTSYEMEVYQPTPAAEIPVAAPPVMPADTAIIGSFPPQYPQPVPGYPQPGYPPMMPPGYPGGYLPPQYPQYPPGYGQPPAFGQPMGYPMGYPQMMPMQPGFPAAVVAPVATPAVVEEEAPAAEMALKLPKPEETGAKPTAAPAPAAGGPAPKQEEKPSTSAADIIKQYMNKRS